MYIKCYIKGYLYVHVHCINVLTIIALSSAAAFLLAESLIVSIRPLATSCRGLLTAEGPLWEWPTGWGANCPPGVQRGPCENWKQHSFTNEFTILTDYHHRGPVKTQYCTHKKVYKFYSFIWQKVVLDMIVIYNRKSNFTQFACLQNFYVLKTVNTVRFLIEGIIYLQLLINIIEGFFVTKLYPFFSFLPLFVSSSKFQL